jgi:hypothetical protein
MIAFIGSFIALMRIDSGFGTTKVLTAARRLSAVARSA